VLARLIPADMPKALELASQVKVELLDPATVKTWGNVLADLTKETDDHRKPVKRIEWMLSYRQQGLQAELLINMVLALGYVALVEVWRGMSSTSKSTVWVEKNDRGWRLLVAGTRNEGGRKAMRGIPGWGFHREAICPWNGKTVAAWSVPIEQWERFGLAVGTYWPNVDGKLATLESVLNEARVLAGAMVTVNAMFGVKPAEEPKPALPVVKVFVGRSGAVKITGPYNEQFVNALKAEVPYGGREWNKESKSWIVNADWANKAVDVARTTYDGKAEVQTISWS
jgi:hypothetical protein